MKYFTYQGKGVDLITKQPRTKEAICKKLKISEELFDKVVDTNQSVCSGVFIASEMRGRGGYEQRESRRKMRVVRLPLFS